MCRDRVDGVRCGREGVRFSAVTRGRTERRKLSLGNGADARPKTIVGPSAFQA